MLTPPDYHTVKRLQREDRRAAAEHRRANARRAARSVSVRGSTGRGRRGVRPGTFRPVPAR